jgi:hypothetical protein
MGWALGLFIQQKHWRESLLPKGVLIVLPGGSVTQYAWKAARDGEPN